MMSPLGAVILLWLTGMMGTAAIILALDVKLELSKRMSPEWFLWVCMIWPYVLWLIIETLFEDDD